MNAHVCVTIKLYVKEQMAVQVWPMSFSLLATALEVYWMETSVGTGVLGGFLEHEGAGPIEQTWVSDISGCVPLKTTPFYCPM